MSEEYIPEPGDKVKWTAVKKNAGSVKGYVDYVELDKGIAYVYAATTRIKYGDRFAQKSRHPKEFSQLTLLERARVDT